MKDWFKQFLNELRDGENTPEKSAKKSEAFSGWRPNSGTRIDYALFWGALAIVACYILYVAYTRYQPAFEPYVAEQDAKQAVFQYYRYYIKGAFPPGHLLTDYAFVYHAQPFYWLMMASLSVVLDPLMAANMLSVLCFLGTPMAAYFALRWRAGHFLALAAAALIARDDIFFNNIAGGSQRAFGPLLVCLFLAAWFNKKRRLVLFTLVLCGGIYPSIAIPCCIAYGLWIVAEFFIGGQQGRVRHIVEFAVTGVIVLVLAQLQNMRAPDWWGPVLWYKEAIQMPAFHAGGKWNLVPRESIKESALFYLTALYHSNGPLLGSLSSWNSHHRYILELGLIFAGAVLVLWKRLCYPLQIPVFFLAAFAGFMLARILEFKLFLPNRIILHTWPYIIAIGSALLWGIALRGLLPSRQKLASGLAAVIVVVPVFLLSGTGLQQIGSYRSYREDGDLYQWVEKNTPLLAQFAGDLQLMNEIPLFSKRQVYVNWKLTHLFRKGYYAEMERRIVKTYDAFYAPDVGTVLKFAAEERIDYFIVDRSRFKVYERGEGQLFEPLRSRIEPFFARCQNRRCTLDPAPAEAIVFHHANYDVVDLSKLAAWARTKSQSSMQ